MRSVRSLAFESWSIQARLEDIFNLSLPAHSRFSAATMLRDARTALDLHRASGEGIVRGLARPDIGFACTKVAHLV